MESCDWQPFLKSAFERNPVSVDTFAGMELIAVYNRLKEWPNESIYSENRIAQPDEVVNFKRGDGIEKALLMANLVRKQQSGSKGELLIYGKEVVLHYPNLKFRFETGKAFPETKLVL